MINLAVSTVAGAALSLSVIDATPAQAASFNFSYTTENRDILSGVLEGTVQADSDTVFVSGITRANLNNVSAPDLPFVESFSKFIVGTPENPTVSFSGLVMDLLACTSPDCEDGFLFDTFDAFDSPTYASGSSYGNTQEIYNPTRWKLTAKPSTSVPEPASVLGLFAVGALGAAFKLKGTKKEKAE